jgi:small GTP-binding protein
MVAIKDLAAKVQELMHKPTQIRNIGTCAHIDHGKTTLSDNLLAGAGLISEELAGQIQALDYDPQEKARGITINAANVSMIHVDDKGNEYLINLIDTPGHVDFGGEVKKIEKEIERNLRNTYILQKIKDKNGVDLLIGNRKELEKVIRALELKPKVTFSLVGMRNGKRVYRATYLIRCEDDKAQDNNH